REVLSRCPPDSGGGYMANIGNAWHIPANRQPPGQPSMRFPLDQIEQDTSVTLSSGNQFQGPGTAGNQTPSGSAVLIRKAGDSLWRSLPVAFQSAAGNDKFFFATIPANMFQAGDAVEYYFKIDYTDRDTTYLHGTDSKSFATASEVAAQSAPFTFSVRHPLE